MRTTVNLTDNSQTQETFTYDAAGNITGGSSNSTFAYDTNNRLTAYNGQAVEYDPDGNMLSAALDCVTTAFEYDSANRLVKAGDHAYTYNAEDVRIRNLCSGHDTTYTYNTNAKLSQLLMKTTNGVVTKYVYGRGLIGEEKQGSFKTYHFDYRGSTVAITDASGSITDTFAYDTYGKIIEHCGNSNVIFGYNGRDGVVTDKNGLIYMRARYYSPELRRFVNADVIHGEISDSTTLNRYAFVNGNPVSYVDPFGLDREDSSGSLNMEELYKLFSSVRSSKNGTGMLASILDQILSFKKLFTISTTGELTIPIDNTTSIFYKVSSSYGDGNVEISNIVAEQLSLLDSISFSGSINEYSDLVFNSDGSIGIEYSYDINEYSSVSASISGIPMKTLSADYTITTKDKYYNSVSTSLGLNHITNSNSQTPTPPATAPALEPVTVESLDWNWLLQFGATAGWTLIAIGALAETFATGGAGFWNDAPAISAAVAAWSELLAT